MRRNRSGSGFTSKGDGLTHETVAAGEQQRHVFSYRPTGWAPEEPGAVSVSDRDPRLVITTFKDLTELGASYWSSMQDRDVAAPELSSLADEITKGIEGKRAQAEAIDHWVKKNIRYVHVFLGSAGVTPNPAPTVLKNKFGDCKDHVALMGALLKAKGIASEQALVNLGNTYRLPDLPIPSFNHVMLYLPEFDLYTDPTASHAVVRSPAGKLLRQARPAYLTRRWPAGADAADEERGSRHHSQDDGIDRGGWCHHGNDATDGNRRIRHQRSVDGNTYPVARPREVRRDVAAQSWSSRNGRLRAGHAVRFFRALSRSGRLQPE